MKDIKRLVKQFRDATNVARDAGEFYRDFSFYKFPNGCCGDTSDLLAQFLLENGIRTCYVCGIFINDSFDNLQSHAWLLTDNHTTIDITGDQFKDNPALLYYHKSVYVGEEDDFYKLFEVADRNICENIGLDISGGMCQPRLYELYGKILKFI